MLTLAYSHDDIKFYPLPAPIDHKFMEHHYTK